MKGESRIAIFLGWNTARVVEKEVVDRDEFRTGRPWPCTGVEILLSTGSGIVSRDIHAVNTNRLCRHVRLRIGVYEFGGTAERDTILARIAPKFAPSRIGP